MVLSESSNANRFFCAEASRENDEQIFGTVGRTQNWTLIEYPQAWRRRAIDDSLLFTPATKRYLKEWEQGNVGRTLLIRQEYECTDKLRVFRIRSGPDNVGMEQAMFASYDELSEVTFDPMPDEPVYAACTHAKHDPCCAKFGLPVHCALQGFVGNRAWQCSHVGGDRFAGNVVVFPWGLYYGRVTPDDVPDIVSATQRGEVYLPLYRGRSCFSRVEQIADFFARRETQEYGIEAVRPLRSVADRSLWQVELTVGTVEFQALSSTVAERLTCYSEECKSVTQYELVSFHGR